MYVLHTSMYIHQHIHEYIYLSMCTYGQTPCLAQHFVKIRNFTDWWYSEGCVCTEGCVCSAQTQPSPYQHSPLYKHIPLYKHSLLYLKHYAKHCF